MPYRPSLRPPARSARQRSPRGRRAGLCAAFLTGSVATILTVGTLTPAPAAAAAVRSDAVTGDVPRPDQQRKPRVTAAVLDLDSPARKPRVYGDDIPYDTASIIKVDILAALLVRSQDTGHRLTRQERAQAEAMIRRSDNAAANVLWRRIGRAPGLAAANKRLGLTSTTARPGAKWGLTRTTATDQIRLLRAVFGTGRPSPEGPTALNEASRTYIRTLMTRIVDEQAWGVSAASDPGWALKNGWLQRDTTGLWDVNSIGRITVDGHHYLVAVLSDGNTSMKDGIAAVERAARAAVSPTTAS
ncbi:hypothetical protein GR925_30630 [Streptomyces sp. HUCO-GS316]|uniref:serine hydrolase n=1 Tax=Streptomyces sp. HUCO-GS316 TaxID=2692198 RepID=UPI001372149C|nr:serine hydrolase [Streptomyces sp. HUCO-GS316]MXM67676.1 hypothetical protein [Streptomyces sp. HUCO-GS316]